MTVRITPRSIIPERVEEEMSDLFRKKISQCSHS